VAREDETRFHWCRNRVAVCHVEFHEDFVNECCLGQVDVVVDQVTIDHNSYTKFSFTQIRDLPDGRQLSLEDDSLVIGGSGGHEVVNMNSYEDGTVCCFTNVEAVFISDPGESKSYHPSVHGLVPDPQSLWNSI
jgi:hypothetical protein